MSFTNKNYNDEKNIYSMVDYLTDNRKPRVRANSEELVEKIVKRVMVNYRITKDELLSKKRNREFVESRQIIMYAMREKFGYTFREAGAYFGKDHATALYGIRNIKGIMQTDKDFNKLVNELI